MSTSPPRLAVQRKLIGDRGKWRTVGRLLPSDSRRVESACLALSALLEPVAWRFVTDDWKQTVVREFGLSASPSASPSPQPK